MDTVRVLFVGDLVGRAGRRVLAEHMDRLVDHRRIDLTVVNVENAADGMGVTPEIAEDLLASGVACMTSGNHIWDKKEIRDYMQHEPRLLRPINYPQDFPGSGAWIGETAGGTRVGVINVMGRIFMPPCNDPFRSVREAVETMRKKTPIIIVDAHAEATSEKMALGWHLDGLVSAVLGTHTHVQTADERILPGGTAYLTDVGMTGPYDSVIGMEKEAAIARFIHSVHGRLSSAKGDPRLCAAIVEIERSGKARSIERICLNGRGPGD